MCGWEPWNRVRSGLVPQAAIAGLSPVNSRDRGALRWTDGQAVTISSSKIPRSSGTTRWLDALSAAVPEVGTAGYWENLESQCDVWAREVTVSAFWEQTANDLLRWRTEFHSVFRGDLLATQDLPQFQGKRSERIRQKIQQKCEADGNQVGVLFPAGRAPVPLLTDLVRTRVQCRFVEGVEFFTDRLCTLLSKAGFDPKRERQGRLEGYFAQHVTFLYPLTYRRGGGSRSVDVSVEVQIATALSTFVWDSTHAIYESARTMDEHPDDWQWNPQDPRFLSRQLGHTIHLADGLLSHLRDKVGDVKRPSDRTGEGHA